MHRLLSLFAALAVMSATLILHSPAVHAGGSSTGASPTGQQTVTFKVDKMTCALCPITVRMAMEQVAGVKSVSVDLEARTATVVFDPSLAAPADIARASTNAGYPASPST